MLIIQQHLCKRLAFYVEKYSVGFLVFPSKIRIDIICGRLESC